MIKIALTCDVERDYSIKKHMPKIHSLFKEYGVIGTWFIQHDYGNHYTSDCGRVDDCFPDIVASLSEVGEIGTHVHFRNKDGLFQTDFAFQKDLLTKATESLRDKGFNIRSFRGGDHFFTKETFQILTELNYSIDSSIMQGFKKKLTDSFVLDYRYDNHIDHFNKPYYLDTKNFLAKGKSNILEIPVTNTLFFLKAPSYFIPFPTPGHMKLGLLSTMIYPLIKTWDFLQINSPIVILFHDFTFNGKNSIKYLEEFLKKGSNDQAISFVTLSDIAKSIEKTSPFI